LTTGPRPGSAVSGSSASSSRADRPPATDPVAGQPDRPPARELRPARREKPRPRHALDHPQFVSNSRFPALIDEKNFMHRTKIILCVSGSDENIMFDVKAR
jgi:hypothetical protein